MSVFMRMVCDINNGVTGMDILRSVQGLVDGTAGETGVLCHYLCIIPIDEVMKSMKGERK